MQSVDKNCTGSVFPPSGSYTIQDRFNNSVETERRLFKHWIIDKAIENRCMKKKIGYS